MKKRSYARPIALLVAVIGAYHVVLFGLHPRLPPVAKTTVVWGELSAQASTPQTPMLDTTLCADAPAAAADKESEADSVFSRVRFEYRPEARVFVNTGSAARIQMDRGSTLTIGKQSYALEQIQFHKRANSDRLAFYLVHTLEGGKRRVVVEVPLQLADKGNPAIDTLWRYLPQRPGEHNSLDDVHVDINNLLPQDRTFYRYAASGNCGKGMVLLGLTRPVQISAGQLTKLDRVLVEQKGTHSL